jgi:hypothetical protein
MLRLFLAAAAFALLCLNGSSQPLDSKTSEPRLFVFHPPPANEPAKLKAARSDFYKVLHLSPNETLRVVVPPFPQERDTYFSARGWRSRMAQQICWVVDDKTLEEAVGSYGSDHEEADIELLSIVASTLRMRPSLIEGPAKSLLNEKMRLDVVLRAETTRSQAIEPLARGIWDQAHIPVKFSLQTVKRDVWVMRGKFKDPKIGADENNPLIVFGKNPPPLNAGDPEPTIVRAGGIETLGDSLSEYLGRQVIVDKIEPPNPRALIRLAMWRNRAADKGTDEDVIMRFSNDTGLSFKREPREVQVLIVDHAR